MKNVGIKLLIRSLRFFFQRGKNYKQYKLFQQKFAINN